MIFDPRIKIIIFSRTLLLQSFAHIFYAGVCTLALASGYVDGGTFKGQIDTCLETDAFCAS
jgi:hypothetical protein